MRLSGSWRSPPQVLGAGRGAGTRLHALIPGGDVLVFRIERLAHARAEIQEAEQEKSAPWIIRKLVGVCTIPTKFIMKRADILSFLVNNWQNRHVFLRIAKSCGD